MKILSTIILLFIILPISHAENKNTGVTSLSPQLQQLFSKEMIQLNQGMKKIMDAYISGQWNIIASIAKKMEGSYVLRQNLTKSQMLELHSKLPKQFLKLDEEFHYYSGMLSHASEKKKTELIGFYFSKMSETCVSCHSLYATSKFSSFNSKSGSNHNH